MFAQVKKTAAASGSAPTAPTPEERKDSQPGVAGKGANPHSVAHSNLIVLAPRFILWRMLRGSAIAILCVLVVSSCASFRPLPDDPNFVLGSNEGILIIHTATDVPVASISIDSKVATKGLRSGVRYDFVVAKAGSHSWTLIELAAPTGSRNPYWRPTIRTANSTGYWDFEVKPGVLNYPGQFEVYLNASTGSPTARLLNRSGLMWVILRDRYPELVERFPLVYTGALRDDFLNGVELESPATTTESAP